MLESLFIKNYAIIDQLSVDFSNGLNALTGETGAGKSIIVGALSLALGYRASADALRAGKDKISVQAVFFLEHPNEELALLLDECGIETEDASVVLRRDVYENGRNVCRVNDIVVNVGTLRQIASFLVDIHGQHEHQKLLNQQRHLSFLDAFAADVLRETSERVRELYEKLKNQEKRLKNLIAESEETKRKQDAYIAALKEIDEAELSEGEDEKAELRIKLLSNSEKLFELIENTYAVTYKKDLSLIDELSKCADELLKASEYDESLAQVARIYEDAAINLQEAAFFLRDYRAGLEYEPEELENLHAKINKINTLKRKYDHTISGILAYAEECREKLQSVADAESLIKEERKLFDEFKSDYMNEARKLSVMRKTEAEKLSALMIDNLSQLAMEHAVFGVEFKDTSELGRIGAHGIDDVSFMISTNPGQELKELSKIASGGEVSRIMLAIKTILADSDQTEALIFDEIDTGISGRTAQIVAEKMNRLSLSHQVICITHLSQLASMADAHYLIKKYVKDGETFTSLAPLDRPERIHELARMLGGVEVTGTTLEHAEEVLQLAEEYKRSENKCKNG